MSSEPVAGERAVGAALGEVPVVAVVVVTHSGPSPMLRACLGSIAVGGGAGHVLVIDNGEGPASIARPDDYGPGVDEAIRLHNDGFGAAANHGTQRVRDRWSDVEAIAVLNDDVEVTVGWLDPLVAALRRSPRIGAVQPKLLLAATTPPRVNSMGVQLDTAGAGSDVGFDCLDGAPWNEARDIEMFTGGAVLFRPEFLVDTGGFDERFFLYYEDVDLALRGAELGWTYRCEPASVVVHALGSTTSGIGVELIRYQERNRLWTAFRFGSIRRIGGALSLSLRRLRHEPRRVHAEALVAGLAAVPRITVERWRARRSRTARVS